MTLRAILLFGNTASGKTTVGRKIEQEFGYPYIGFGELLRTTHPLAMEITQAIAAKQEVPAALAIQLITDNIHVSTSHVVISGFPITMGEFGSFVKTFTPIKGVHLVVSDAVAQSRYAHRNRQTDTMHYFMKRMHLYHSIIVPFIQSIPIPILTLDTEYFNETEVFTVVWQWLIAT